MDTKNNKNKEVYKTLIDITCGDYKPGDLDAKQQERAIHLLRCRFASMKNDEMAREEFGPLQPAKIISQISRVPEEIVRALANEFSLELPSEIEIDEPLEELFETEGLVEDLTEIVSSIDEEDDYVDVELENDDEEESNFGFPTYTQVEYLENILSMMKNGNVKSISVVAVNNNGEASIWVPSSVEEQKIEKLFSPLINAMINESTTRLPN